MPSRRVVPGQIISPPKVATPSTPQQEVKKLENIAEQANTVLFRASTVFPFTLFPTEIVIDQAKISIVHHDLFHTGQVASIDINSVVSVVAEVSILFGSLKLIQQWLPDELNVINYLWKNDAIEARRIIQGLIISKHENVNLAQMNDVAVRDTIQEMGQTKTAL